jgi:nucleoside-diphosphate-sugar epimerase
MQWLCKRGRTGAGHRHHGGRRPERIHTAAEAGEETAEAPVTGLGAVTAACQRADTVIHLAGIPGESSWPRILELTRNGILTTVAALAVLASVR